MTTKDPGTLPAFYDAQWPRLRGAAVLLVGDVAEGEDIAQEALARVAARWTSVQGMRTPEGYAYRVMINLVRRRWRQASRVVVGVGDADHEGVDEAERLVTALAVRAAVGALPPRQRMAVVLRYLVDLDVASTAAAMGCRAGTVRALTAQGLAGLRRSGLDLDARPELQRGGR